MSEPASARPLWRYRDPDSHEAVSRLIRLHSTNPRDVRAAVLKGVDLSSVEEVLDLGCGFGFMAEAVARRLSPRGRITGVDACRGNRAAFCARVRATGRRARFIPMDIDKRLPWPDRSYDLVMSTYSLYFFPQILPDVVRVLQPAGRFLAVTHSAESVRRMFQLAGIPERHTPWVAVVSRFSAENGAGVLGRFFTDVASVAYANSLRFGRDDVDDLLRYLAFRLESFNPPPDFAPDLTSPEIQALRRRLAVGAEGTVVEKNDVAFWCSGPRADAEPTGD